MASLDDNIEAINNAYEGSSYGAGTADDKGRPHVDLMSDRMLLEEMVTTTRATRDLVETFVADMAKNPMLGMLGGMMGKRGK